MDIYYEIKSSSLVEDMDSALMDSLNEFCLSRLNYGGTWLDTVTGKRRAIIESWDDVYNRGADGYVVNIIIDTIKKGKYKKSEVYSSFEGIVYPYLKKYGCDSGALKDIFHKAWLCRYADKGNNKGERTPLVMDYALKKQPIILRLVNSNGFLIFFGILFLSLSGYVGILFVDTASLFVALCAGLVGFCASEKNILWFPLVAMFVCIIVCLYHVLFTEESALMYAKQNLWVGLSFLLWYPVILINKERLYDKYLIR